MGRSAYLVLALRWASLTTGCVVALTRSQGEVGVVVAALGLAVYTLARTFRPIPGPGDQHVETPALAVELLFTLLVLAVSGWWGSPFVLALLVPVVLTGMSFGLREAQAHEAIYADRVSRLTETNDLLARLSTAAKTLPSSLDLGDTLTAAMGQLRQLFDFTGASILVSDAATGTWRAEAASGLPVPAPMASDALPAPARVAVHRRSVVAEPALESRSAGGLWPSTRSGLYCPLEARGRLVALVALEHEEPARYGATDADLIAGLAEPLALAIDNALFFGRLGMLGADAERDRMARNLHDRLGQGLAYINIELDRLSRIDDPSAELIRLRGDVGELLGEMRETLRQLRTRVTDTAAFADLARAHVARFADRTGLSARFEAEDAPRLPVAIEQELWRILQEAMANVERHARAKTLEVRWSSTGRAASLEVVDDGAGFDVAPATTGQSSGFAAMRERANAIGARLLIDSAPGRGTRVVIDVEIAELESTT